MVGQREVHVCGGYTCMQCECVHEDVHMEVGDNLGYHFLCVPNFCLTQGL